MSVIEDIATPRNADEVAAAVRDASARGLRVAVSTERMRGVEIDVAARCARVQAGATWSDLVRPASELGLAAPHSRSGASIVGTCLSGGLGLYARKYGLAGNHVTAIEIVTADGALIRATPDRDPALFWALRGGGGGFGVVCALELRLFPLRAVCAGTLSFDRSRTGEVLSTWSALLPGLPEEMSSVVRVDADGVAVDAAYLGSERGAAALLAPLRALRPASDTIATVPPAGLLDLGAASAPGAYRLLSRMPTALTAATGPFELRHTGGALARSAEHHGALDTLPGELCLSAPAEVVATVAEFDAGERLDADARELLSAVKAALDPADLFGR